MKVYCCGYRKWRDGETIRARLAALPPDTVVLHPDPTTDQAWLGALVARLAQEIGLAHEPTSTADGTLPEGTDLVLAFHTYLPGSRHTKAVVDEAARRGIPVEVRPRRGA